VTNNPDVTISIVNWNTQDELRECLQTVLIQNGSIRFEVIVVDNASSDGSADMVRTEFAEKVKLILNEVNRGFGAAHNQAITESRGRYVFLLNPDCRIIDEKALSRMVEYMDSHLDIGMLGPKVVYPDGRLQFSARRFPTFAAALFRHTPLGRFFPHNRFVRKYLMEDWDHLETADVDWLSGAALMIRKKTIEEIGLLDERFFMYVEDMDWCKRAHMHGWRVVYYPEVEVAHRIGASSDQKVIPMIHEHRKSMLRYFLKYNARSVKVLLTPLVALGLWLMAQSRIALTKRGR
jgi:GT2 family glycosyltransferase